MAKTPKPPTSKITVYTAGVWDMFHVGHLNLLKASKALGDRLIVGVITDDGCMSYKFKRPVVPHEDRWKIVQALKCVDAVVSQNGTNPTGNLESLQGTKFEVSVFTHGSDWDRLKQGHSALEKMGIRYVTLPYTEGVSSTILRQKAEE
jgi:cytidyltransferase-like protein